MSFPAHADERRAGPGTGGDWHHRGVVDRAVTDHRRAGRDIGACLRLPQPMCGNTVFIARRGRIRGGRA
jgi:hypothetical protein